MENLSKRGWLLVGLPMTLLILVSCGVSSPRPASTIKSAEDILDMQRVGNDYIVTCLDGSSQKIPVATFESVPSTEICAKVLSADCPSVIKYKTGQNLRQSATVFNYPNGKPIKSGGTVYYFGEKKPLFKNTSGAIFYGDGKPLRTTDGTFYYPSGKPLKKQGIYYYPDGNVLKQNNGILYYPNGTIMKTSSTSGSRGSETAVKSPSSFNYSDGSPMKTAAGVFYYEGQKPVRSGSILYREDKSMAVTPIMLEQKIGDGEEFGSLRFAVEAQSDAYSLSLPTITPEIGLIYDPKSTEFRMRFQLDKNEAPIVMTIDERGAPRIYMFVSTGYPGERIVLFGNSLTSDLQCRAVHTAEE